MREGARAHLLALSKAHSPSHWLDVLLQQGTPLGERCGEKAMAVDMEDIEDKDDRNIREYYEYAQEIPQQDEITHIAERNQTQAT